MLVSRQRQFDSPLQLLTNQGQNMAAPTHGDAEHEKEMSRGRRWRTNADGFPVIFTRWAASVLEVV